MSQQVGLFIYVFFPQFLCLEEGWPLGLQPLNARVGLPRNRDFSGSISFNTLLTGSPTCSTDSSSDLDTESTGSFFHDRSITLGSLIGVSSILELSRRSIRGRKSEPSKEKKTNNNNNKSNKSRIWCFSLCPSNTTDAEIPQNAPSLGQFLEVERKAANECRRSQLSPTIYGPDELALAQPLTEPNSLFVNGCIAPPRPKPCSGTDTERKKNIGLDDHDIESCGISLLLSSCISAQSSH